MKFSAIVVILLLTATVFPDSLSTPASSAQTNSVTDRFGSNDHSALMAKGRFVQSRQLSFGYSTSGKSSASVFSYTHGLDYTLSSTIRTALKVDISQVSSKGLSKTQVAPSVHLDWRPKDGTVLKLDLKLAPQVISGENFLVDPWHRPIGF